jgi:hypothetical protein
MAKPNYDYLDEERKKIWHRLILAEKEIQSLEKQLTEELTKKAGDYTDSAKQSSRIATGYKNKSELSKNTILQYQVDAEASLSNINAIQDSVNITGAEISRLANIAAEKHDEIVAVGNEVTDRKTNIEEDIQELEELFEDVDSLTDKLSKLKDILSDSEDTLTKIEAVSKVINGRKKELDELFIEVFGYTDEKDNTEVEGLKDQLESAYDELSKKIEVESDNIEQVSKKASTSFSDFSNSVNDQHTKHLDDWTSRYEGLENKIESLLPNALTAGLSSAYSEKKTIEIKEYENLNKTFIKAIAGLIIVSILPLCVGCYSLATNKSFDKVIEDLPRLVLSFLPLYIPVLWVAYSSSKKMNLSKRLSEEYSHKEVLSKTFEGLSSQIENISDSKISEDLKNKLLYNLLEVSSENPGKLISDYNKADHPLMDALDKSVQLATAVEKLEKLPGFSKLAQKVNNRSKTIIVEENIRANKGLDVIAENGSPAMNEN